MLADNRIALDAVWDIGKVNDMIADIQMLADIKRELSAALGVLHRGPVPTC